MFRITETTVYLVPAASAEQAEQKFLDAPSRVRDREYFSYIPERDVQEAP